jgi:hypothetical protein
MEPDPPDERDELGFRLAWPADAAAAPLDLQGADAASPAADSAPQPSSEPVDDASFEPPDADPRSVPPRPSPPPRSMAPSPAPTPAPVGHAIALGDDVAALAAVAARVDALSSATITFRNALAGQVTEYTQRVAQAIAEHAGGLDHAIRGQDRAMGEVTAQLRQVTGQLGQVASAVEAIVTNVDEFRAEVAAALEAMGEEVRALRRRTPVRPRGGLERAELDAITSAVADALREEGRPAPARRRPRQA